MTRSFASYCLIILILLVAGCSKDSPTSPTTAATAVYTGTIDPLGTAFATFTLSDTRTTWLTFASLTAVGSNMADATPLTFGLGTSTGDTCTVTSAVVTPATLTAQMTTSLGAGNYCVSIADPDGVLAGSMQYAMRVVAGDFQPSGAAGSQTIVLTIPLGGSSSRPFTATAPGTASVYLALDTTEEVGLALGIPREDSSGCFVGASQVTTSVDAVVSAAVDAGRYCVKLFDPGALTASSTSVSVTLTRP